MFELMYFQLGGPLVPLIVGMICAKRFPLGGIIQVVLCGEGIWWVGPWASSLSTGWRYCSDNILELKFPEATSTFARDCIDRCGMLSIKLASISIPPRMHSGTRCCCLPHWPLAPMAVAEVSEVQTDCVMLGGLAQAMASQGQGLFFLVDGSGTPE
jgi:hypothetical protein